MKQKDASFDSSANDSATSTPSNGTRTGRTDIGSSDNQQPQPKITQGDSRSGRETDDVKQHNEHMGLKEVEEDHQQVDKKFWSGGEFDQFPRYTS